MTDELSSKKTCFVRMRELAQKTKVESRRLFSMNGTGVSRETRRNKAESMRSEVKDIIAHLEGMLSDFHEAEDILSEGLNRIGPSPKAA